MTREEAASKGLKRYMGEPCGKGHPGERYVNDKSCVCCKNSVAIRKRNQPSHHKPRIAAPPKRELPSPHVIHSDFIKAPTLARLMAGR